MADNAMERTFRDLAITAGDAIMKVYSQSELEVRAKSDKSPVTEADEAADAIIRAGLKESFPEVAVITEEMAESHNLRSDRFIIVDPLDGTKEFVKKGSDFTVNIALVEFGVPVKGVVYAPALGRLFRTDGIGRAVEESVGGEIIRDLQVSRPTGNLRVVASKSHRDRATDDYIGLYPVEEFTSAGSSLKFCLVASGEAHLYPRLGPTMEWDTAAGDAVLRAAGGRMVEFDTHEDFRYGKPDYRNGFFIAFAPGVELKRPST